MGRLEKSVVLVWPIWIIAAVVALVWIKPRLAVSEGDGGFALLVSVCLSATFWGQLVVVLAIRDLYLRHFNGENAKLTWCLLILMTGCIGLVVYLYRYSFRSRLQVSPPPCDDLGTRGLKAGT